MSERPASGPVILVVLLHLHRGREREFEEYERQAFRIMARYGGTLERRMRRGGGDSAGPDEVHVVSFPDEESFRSYRSDGEVEALSALRRDAIRDTVVWRGRDLPPFSAASR
ncbi:MAG: DUF1330 domain-containing protein [Candidatus Binatia bacterium]